jgi:hypothetical protein
MTTRLLIPDSGRRPLVSREFWILAAVIAYSVAGFYGPPDVPGLHMATVTALFGLVAASAAFIPTDDKQAFGWLAGCIAVATFLLIRLAEPFLSPELPPRARVLMTVWFPLALILGAAGSILLLRSQRRVLAAIVLAASLIMCGALVIVTSEEPVIDVLMAHQAAADAVASGMSPYNPEVVVEDTSPYAPSGHGIVGYPYPPLTAYSYVLGEWVFGDARWLSLLLLAATAALFAFMWGSPIPKPASVLLATLPGWPIVLFLGFTEPLTILLLCACLITWDKEPWIATVAGGLAIASKQYMLVVAPLLLVYAYRREPKRALVMTLAGIATVAPFAIADWNDMVRSTFTNLAELPIRPDGSSIQGLLLNLGSEIEIPLWLSLGFPLCISLILAFKARSRREVALGACIALTSFFLLGSQAFINYWFLVACVAVLAYGLPEVPLAVESSISPKAPIRNHLNRSGDLDDQV